MLPSTRPLVKDRGLRRRLRSHIDASCTTVSRLPHLTPDEDSALRRLGSAASYFSVPQSLRPSRCPIHWAVRLDMAALEERSLAAAMLPSSISSAV